MSIKRLSTKSIITCVSIVLVLVMTSVLFLGFVLPKNITIVDSDSEAKVKTLAKTVEEVLEENNIALAEGDVVTPEMTSEIKNKDVITIKRSKKVTLYADNRTYEIRTVAKTVADLLDEVDVSLSESDALSCSGDAIITDNMEISVKRADLVKITFAGQTFEEYTIAATVKDFLNEEGVILGEHDEVAPSLETAITNGMEIIVYRVTVEEITLEEAIAFKTVNKDSQNLEKGKTSVEKEGVNGTAKNTYKIVKKDGEQISNTLVSSETIKKPVDKVVLNGTKEAPKAAPKTTQKTVTKETQKTNNQSSNKTQSKTVPSRGDLRYKKVITCSATAYEPGVQSNGKYAGKTATGLTAGPGIVAVDPSVIPLGSRLYIESTDDGKSWTYGYAIAGDTGGAIKGHKIDLCFSTVAECYNFGRRQCKVYILE